MEITFKRVPLNEVNLNPNNPRIIKDDKFKKLVNSIREFPEMLEIKPIIVDEDNVILGGNMRYIACKQLGLTHVPVVTALNLTESQKQEFLIKDNVSYGEWDWDALANEYEFDNLIDWGVDVVTWKSDYTPEYNPVFDTSDVTREEVEKRAHELAKNMVKTMQLTTICCPECGYEFEVS